MNGKIVFFPLLPFSYDVNRRRDAKRLLAVLYFSFRREEYIEILFSLPFLLFSSVSHLFAFIYAFNLPFSSPSTFPSHSKQRLFAASASSPRPGRRSGLLGKIRCNLTFFHSSEGISLVAPRAHDVSDARCVMFTCFRLNFSRFPSRECVVTQFNASTLVYML